MLLDQSLGLGHELKEVKSGHIPFEHGKLGRVRL